MTNYGGGGVKITVKFYSYLGIPSFTAPSLTSLLIEFIL